MTDDIKVLTFCTTSGKPLRFESGRPELKPPRRRKPSMTAAARLAKKEGVRVEYPTPDGPVSFTPVDSVSGHQETVANDLDKWIAKRHAH